MDWHPSGKSLAVPTLSGIVLITKPEGDFNVWLMGSKLEDSKQEAFIVKWSPNGRYLASGHADSSVYVWDSLSKLSIDRSKCPDLPLSVQWNRASNTLLLCLANGRYAEWSGVIPRTLPDPIKPFDSASLAAQEYESQKQTLDNMFADEESAPKQTPQPTTIGAASTSSAPKPATSSSIPSVAPSRSAPTRPTTTTSSNVNNQASRDAESEDDDRVDVYAKRHTMDLGLGSSHFDSGRFGSSIDDDVVDVLGRGSSRGFGESSYGVMFDLQAPFMPSSTQGGSARRILAWTHFGSIVARVEEYPTLQTSLEMDFSDVSVYKPFSLTQPFAVDLATLSEQGVFTSSRQVSRDHRVTTTLQYNAFNKFGHKSDWSFRLEHGECAVSLASGDTWSAVATTFRRLRLFGEAGSRMAVISLPGPIVSMCAHGPLLGLVFHSGAPMGNGQLPKSFSSAVDAVGVSDEGNSQTLGWWVFNVHHRRLLSSGYTLPISPGATLTWIGFSTEGALCSFDSKFVLRQLAATEHFVLASTPLVSIDTSHAMSSVLPSWSHMWFEVLDAQETLKSNGDLADEDVVWPIAVTHEKLRYVMHSSRSEGPNAQPKPVPKYLALNVPFTSPSSSSAASESFESSLVRSNVSMACVIGKAIDAKLDTEGAMGEVLEDSSDLKFLVDLSSDKQVLEAQAKMDGLVLKLIREASQDGHVERALSLAKSLVLKKSLQVAITVASKTGQSLLADKISEWTTRREHERKRVAEATKRMVSTSSSSSSHGSQTMSLPRSFDNYWTDTRKHQHQQQKGGGVVGGGLKRNAPDLPSPSSKKMKASTREGQVSKHGHGSDDEFEVEDDDDEEADEQGEESPTSTPARKKFVTQAIDDDDDDGDGDGDDGDSVVGGAVDDGFDEIENGNGESHGEDARRHGKRHKDGKKMDIDQQHDGDHEELEEDGKRGKEGSVFKSNPFTIAPPFRQDGAGRLSDTLSSIGKAKKGSPASASPTTSKATSSSSKKTSSSVFKPAPSKKK